MKKKRIKEDLAAIVAQELDPTYQEMADELLTDNSPEAIIAGLLQYTFQDELSPSSYKEIVEAKSKVDVKGKTRLFVSHGKRDGLTPKKLIKIITEECDIPYKLIRDISILDSFSFVSLPFHEAEMVLSYFQKSRNKKSNLQITKAKDDRKKGDRNRGDRKYGDRNKGDKKFGDKHKGDKKFGDRHKGKKNYGEKNKSGEKRKRK
ncbi:DbpA RNA binding domain-containing protein [Candidatus Omnitrophota bacterium]